MDLAAVTEARLLAASCSRGEQLVYSATMIAHGIVDRDKSLPFISAKLTVYNSVAQFCDPRSWICKAAIEGQVSGYPVVNVIGGLGGGRSDTVGDCLGIHRLIAEFSTDLASTGLLQYRCVNCGALLSESTTNHVRDLIATASLDQVVVVAVSCRDFLRARFGTDQTQTFDQPVFNLLLLLAVEFVVLGNELQRVSSLLEKEAQIESLDLIRVVLFSVKVNSFQSRVGELVSQASAAIAEVKGVGAILLVDASSRQVERQATLALEGSCNECGFRADIENSNVSGVGVTLLGYTLAELSSLTLSSLSDEIAQVRQSAGASYLETLDSTLESLVQAGCGELTCSKNLSELNLVQMTTIKLVLASELNLPAGVILLDPLLEFVESQQLNGVAIALEKLLKAGWAAISWGNLSRWRDQLGEHTGKLVVGDSMISSEAKGNAAESTHDIKKGLPFLDPGKVAMIDRVASCDSEQMIDRAKELFKLTQSPELLVIDLGDPPTAIARIAQLSMLEIVGLPEEFAALANLTSDGKALVGVTELEINEFTVRSAALVFAALPSLANRISSLAVLGLENFKLSATVMEIPFVAQLGCIILHATQKMISPSIRELERGKRAKLAAGTQSIKLVAIGDPFVWLLPHELGYIAQTINMFTLAGAFVLVNDQKFSH